MSIKSYLFSFSGIYSLLRRTFQLLSLLAIFVFSQSLYADSKQPLYSTRFSNLALNGYDAVAYFTDHGAYKGKKEFQYEWKGAKWRFYSQENMDKFVLDPQSYEPQFGGYCSYAMGLGQKASSDPTQYSIVDGKLYMNYSSKTKILWEGDLANMIDSGRENWDELIEN